MTEDRKDELVQIAQGLYYADYVAEDHMQILEDVAESRFEYIPRQELTLEEAQYVEDFLDMIWETDRELKERGVERFKQGKNWSAN